LVPQTVREGMYRVDSLSRRCSSQSTADAQPQLAGAIAKHDCPDHSRPLPAESGIAPPGALRWILQIDLRRIRHNLTHRLTPQTDLSRYQIALIQPPRTAAGSIVAAV